VNWKELEAPVKLVASGYSFIVFKVEVF